MALDAKTAVADGRWARVGSTNLAIAAAWLGITLIINGAKLRRSGARQSPTTACEEGVATRLGIAEPESTSTARDKQARYETMIGSPHPWNGRCE